MDALGIVGRALAAAALAAAGFAVVWIGVAMLMASGNLLAILVIVLGAGVAFVSMAPLAYRRRTHVRVGDMEEGSAGDGA